MSTAIMNDAVSISSTSADSQSAATAAVNNVSVVDAPQGTVEFAKCECCGLTEECTLAYIARVRERYHGRWVCGLCAEAVKDEVCRSGFLISTEEALNRHMAFCKKFLSSSPPANPTGHLISAVKHLLRRSLDSPHALRSAPNSPRRDPDGKVVTRPSLARSGSCFPTLAS